MSLDIKCRDSFHTGKKRKINTLIRQIHIIHAKYTQVYTFEFEFKNNSYNV